MSQRTELSPWQTFLSFVVVFFALSYYVTGNWLWGYETRWTNTHYIQFRLFDSPQIFREEELSKYDGSDPALPIYLAINGSVFDVSARPDVYGPLGAYRFFSGRDAARAFATGCFASDLTHDLRGLSEEEHEMIRGWIRFFSNNVKYWEVGTVEHEPLTGDPPKPCRGNLYPN